MGEQANGTGTIKVFWGVERIAKEIQRTPRQTNHMLAIGALPGAKKVAGRWVISEQALHALFEAA